MNVVVVNDDIAEIDTNPPVNTGVIRRRAIALANTILPFKGAAHRIDDTREFDEQPVASGMHDAAVALSDRGVNQLDAHGFQASYRAFLVEVYHPRIAGDVGREDGSEAADGRHVLTTLVLKSLRPGACSHLAQFWSDRGLDATPGRGLQARRDPNPSTSILP